MQIQQDVSTQLILSKYKLIMAFIFYDWNKIPAYIKKMTILNIGMSYKKKEKGSPGLV